MVDSAKTKPAGEGNSFEEFISAARKYFNAVADEIVKASGDNDDAPLLASHAESLKEQAGKVLGFTVDRFERSNSESKRFVVEFCDSQAVTGMALRSTKTLQDTARKGIFGDGIFSWIESVAQEIKKLINEIWSIFGTVPPWFEALKQIIDQIIKFLVSLFGGILGRNRSRISADLSNMEVEFWNELAARRKFVNVLLNRGNDVED